ncbi:MAG: hypothetical protein NTW67_05095 [Candidatus Woesearchaeota archaeon]|nr:hypothetical protein [Candidatus Woesearchaeota archaeon]
MRKTDLQPEQILIPGEYELGNESILKIYFRIFGKGHGKDLPPVIVARNDITGRSLKDKYESVVQHLSKRGYMGEMNINAPYNLGRARETYARFNELIAKAPFYLFDGNHRTTAATLTHRSIHALELQSDEDIAEARRMIERGQLFDFKRPETSLRELVTAFEEYIIGNDRFEGLRKPY